MKRLDKTKSVVASLIVLLAAVGSVHAAHPDYSALDCGSSLNLVGAAIDDAKFVGQNALTSQSNLLTKLANAATKISQKKYPDAIDKLGDISDAATALANAPKPKLEDATQINTSATNAILCVGTLPQP